MTLPLSCALGAAVLLGSPEVHETFLAHVEVAAGYAPRAPGRPSAPAVATEARPGLRVAVSSPRLFLTMEAGPRIYFRWPALTSAVPAPGSEDEIRRPLVLGRATLTSTYHVSPRLRWISGVGGTFGETDYTTPSAAFGTGAARELDESILRVAAGDARTGFAWQVTPVYALDADVFATHSQSFSERTTGLPATTGVGGTLSQRWTLSERETLSFPLRPQYTHVASTRDWFGATLEAIYSLQATRRTRVELSGGTLVSKTTGNPVTASPRAGGAVEHVVLERPTGRLTSRLAASAAAANDPTLGRLIPTASLDGALGSQLGTDWTIFLSASGNTTTTSEPTRVGASDTSVSAGTGLTYRLSTVAGLTFGLRTSARGPHVTERPFVLTDRQFWGYVALDFDIPLDSRIPVASVPR